MKWILSLAIAVAALTPAAAMAGGKGDTSSSPGPTVSGPTLAGAYYLKGNATNATGDSPTAFSTNSGQSDGGWIFTELHPTGTALAAKCLQGDGCWGLEADGVGRGVYGVANQTQDGSESYGVYGITEGSGSLSAGVLGRTDGIGPASGVEGSADLLTGTGVFGHGGRYGVRGSSGAGSGVGILAENTGGGTALKASGKSTFTGQASFDGGFSVTGKSTFSRSGLLTAPGGTSSIVKSSVSLSSSSYVLATIQTNTPGVSVRAAVPNPGSSTITIYFSANAPAGTKVAWFIVN
jgi:hypothetical protein